MNKKIAAIDIGTNSFHLVIVEIFEDGHFEIIDREKEVIRLSENSKGDIKKITKEASQRAIEALKKFSGIAESHNAEVKAVATSAVRESQNKLEFINQVSKECGIDIEVISGVEEGRLIYLGVINAVPVYNTRILTIDIGGGSTEFVVGLKGNILYANSLKLGAVRLTKLFFPDYKVTKSKIKECKSWIEGVLNPLTRDIVMVNITSVIGSSGTIMAAALMIKSMKEKTSSITILNNYKFSYQDLLKIQKVVLNAKTVDERNKIKGLDEKRADIIPAGIILLTTIFEQFKINEMTVSGYALREGIIIDSIKKEFNISGTTFQEDLKSKSIEKLAKSCNYDKSHCNHVAELALSLFEKLNPIHKLPKNYSEYLISAAKLHDIGYHIAHSKHHKHSQYLIANSELLGFNENEIKAISCIARYHRKSHPKNSHDDFNELPENWKNIVLKLSAILRIADALDRTHKKLINNFEIKIGKNKVSILIPNDLEDVDIELWSFERRKQLFEVVYNYKIDIKNF